MSADAIIRKYSQALFEVSEDLKKSEQVGHELEAVAKIFSQTEARVFFESPFNSGDNKTMVAKSSLEGKCSPELFNFMITLVQNDRVGFVADISTAFQALVRARGGETEGVLYVSGEASAGLKEQVEQKLTKALNKKVKLTVEKDPALLSGYKVTVGGWSIDDSAQYHLNKIKEEISKRGL